MPAIKVCACGNAHWADRPHVCAYSGMEPRENPRQPIFRDHNCGACSNGQRPCREGDYAQCSNPRARND